LPSGKGPLIGRREELTLLLAALEAGRHLLIEGPVGVGKTRLAQEAAGRLRRSVIRVDGDERFGEDKLTGWFDPPAVLTWGYRPESFRPGPLHRAMTQGAILFLNELNRMPEGVQNVLLAALDEGRLEVPKAEPVLAAAGFQVVATLNPVEFVGTSLISEALRDRFELMNLDYQSFEEEEAIVGQETGLADAELIKQAVFLTRSTRTHPRVKRGASVRAAISLSLIASRLEGREALAKAAAMALPTRLELKDSLENESGFDLRDFVAELLKKKPLPTRPGPGMPG